MYYYTGTVLSPPELPGSAVSAGTIASICVLVVLFIAVIICFIMIAVLSKVSSSQSPSVSSWSAPYQRWLHHGHRLSQLNCSLIEDKFIIIIIIVFSKLGTTILQHCWIYYVRMWSNWAVWSSLQQSYLHPIHIFNMYFSEIYLNDSNFDPVILGYETIDHVKYIIPG